MNNDNEIILIDDQGNESPYEVLFTFDSEDYDKSYVLLINKEDVDKEDADINAFSYVSNEDDHEALGELFPIEDDAEWDMVEEVLNTFIENEMTND